MSAKIDVSQNEYTKEAYDYLSTGGLGEVMGFTELSRRTGHPKVQCDTDMMTAILVLASEALELRQSVNRGDHDH